ncbi:hypothetical protein TNCV_2143031 [Trichonephila clavipes]|nr:hypothetical protein TNCV_2143031 [Trichonephila clavipes]
MRQILTYACPVWGYAAKTNINIVSHTPHLTATECARLSTPHLTVTECARFFPLSTPTKLFGTPYRDILKTKRNGRTQGLVRINPQHLQGCNFHLTALLPFSVNFNCKYLFSGNINLSTISISGYYSNSTNGIIWRHRRDSSTIQRNKR